MAPRLRKRRSLKETLIIGVLTLVLLLLLVQVWNIARKEEIARKAADDVRRELSLVLEREATLQHTLTELETERGRDATVRETFGVARPGEEVIIVVTDEADSGEGELSWWRTFLGWFGW